MYLDPIYWIMIAVCGGMSLLASMLVKGTFAKFSRFTTRRGMTGADVARSILRDNDIHDVKVEPVAGNLSDHYDPRSKTLRLSEPVFGSSSMSAFGVAAHEVGHAIQHARGYLPLKLRSGWVPIANAAGGFSTIVLIGAMLLGGAHTAIGTYAAIAGVALMGATTLFTLITLPVEFDASRRALATLRSGGYATEEEIKGARKVLTAAALTYVAAFVTSLLTLLYWAHALGLLGGRRQE